MICSKLLWYSYSLTREDLVSLNVCVWGRFMGCSMFARMMVKEKEKTEGESSRRRLPGRRSGDNKPTSQLTS